MTSPRFREDKEDGWWFTVAKKWASRAGMCVEPRGEAVAKVTVNVKNRARVDMLTFEAYGC